MIVLFLCFMCFGLLVEIQVRLVNGPDASQGRVEIQKVSRNVEDNPWGTICNDQYEVNNKAATVICRQLGYVWGVSRTIVVN